jgi:hypothetical protein
MKTNEIDTLIQTTEVMCLSIIFSTDPVNRKKNSETLKKSIQKAKALLKNKSADSSIKKTITNRLTTIIRRIMHQDWVYLYLRHNQLSLHFRLR